MKYIQRRYPDAIQDQYFTYDIYDKTYQTENGNVTSFDTFHLYPHKALLIPVLDKIEERIMGILILYSHATFYMDACNSHQCLPLLPSVKPIPCLLETYEDCEHHLTVFFICLDFWFVCEREEHYEKKMDMLQSVNPIHLFRDVYNFPVSSFDDYVKKFEQDVMRSQHE